MRVVGMLRRYKEVTANLMKSPYRLISLAGIAPQTRG